MDYEGKVISALNDLQEERKKNKLLIREVNRLKQKLEEIREVKRELSQLRRQIEEVNETAEDIFDQLRERDILIKELKEKMAAVGEKREHRSSQHSSSKTLDDVINSKKSYLDKTGLGYNSFSTNKIMDCKVNEDNQKIYKDILKIRSCSRRFRESMMLACYLQ